MRRFFVGLIGGTVVLIGIAMILLPGPAILIIPAGLAILATEFLWARRALATFKDHCAKVKKKVSAFRSKKAKPFRSSKANSDAKASSVASTTESA